MELVPVDWWRSWMETLYLMWIPGMADSIKEGMAVSIEDCSEDAGW